MPILKNIFRRALRALGYDVHRASEDPVRFSNFADLAQAYEQGLNATENLIAPNAVRPKLMARLMGTAPTEAYFIVQALAKTQNLSGGVCEFGVAQGETSALIANEILPGNKILHLFDSFQGLPKPSEKDQLKDDIFSLGNIQNYAGKMSCPEAMVRARLKAVSFPAERFVIHKGFIEQVLREDARLPKDVSFAYVDFDFYEPIKVTLEFLHNVTRPGAILIVDDYDFFSTGAKAAVDEFLKDKNASRTVYECLIPDKARYGCFAVLTRV